MTGEISITGGETLHVIKKELCFPSAIVTQKHNIDECCCSVVFIVEALLFFLHPVDYEEYYVSALVKLQNSCEVVVLGNNRILKWFNCIIYFIAWRGVISLVVFMHLNPFSGPGLEEPLKPSHLLINHSKPP